MSATRTFAASAATAALLGGCASVSSPACADMTGVQPRLVERNGRTFLVGYDYGDEASRVRHLHCLADQGSQDAQVELARRYEAGNGVPQDFARAGQLYERAARVIPSATPIYSPPVRLGGSGRVILVANPNATAGSPVAKYRLGLLLIDGRGGPADPRRGVALIESAARLGDAEAQQWLAQRQRSND